MIGERFPYVNFHDLNLDWIIKIIKEFLDNYSSIQTSITDGVDTLNGETESGVSEIDDAKDDGLDSIQALINSGLSAIRNLIDSAYTRNYIILGDSYGTRLNFADQNFYEYLKALNVINNTNSYFSCSPGAGFVHVDPTNTFTALLQNIVVADPLKITDIIIECGANDNFHTYEEITQGLNSFRQYANEHYPLARLWLFPCGLTMKPDAFRTRETVTLTAFKNAGRQGFNYVPNAEFTLCNTAYLESDRCHPNGSGVNMIAYMMASAIYTGHCNVRHELQASNVNSAVSLTGDPSPASAIVAASSSVWWRTACKNETLNIIEDYKCQLLFNLNNVSIGLANRVVVTMDNVTGLPTIGGIKKCLFKNEDYDNPQEVMGSYEITYDEDTSKYVITMRPLGTISSGTTHNALDVYLLDQDFTM